MAYFFNDFRFITLYYKRKFKNHSLKIHEQVYKK